LTEGVLAEQFDDLAQRLERDGDRSSRPTAMPLTAF